MRNNISIQKLKSLPSSLHDHMVISLYPVRLFDELKLNIPINRKTFKEVIELYSNLSYSFSTFDVGIIRERQMFIIIQPWHKNGSLRDMIYNTNPSASFDDKLLARCDSNKGTCLSEEQIRCYGKQILEALLNFRQTGIVFSHRTMTSCKIISYIWNNFFLAKLFI